MLVMKRVTVLFIKDKSTIANTVYQIYERITEPLVISAVWGYILHLKHLNKSNKFNPENFLFFSEHIFKRFKIKRANR